MDEIVSHSVHTNDPGEDMARKVKCESCGSPAEGFFCVDCHTILPFSKETDYFTMMQVEKRPCVDLNMLRENFLKVSEVIHPDKYYNASQEVKDLAITCSSLLNKAYSTLRDPKERIKYLISIETDKEAPVSSRASAETMEFFIEASDICNETDSFLKKGGSGDDRKRELRSRLQEYKKESQGRWNKVLKDIDKIDKEWIITSSGERKPLLRRLLVLSHELSYLTKLQSMLDEMMIALS